MSRDNLEKLFDDGERGANAMLTVDLQKQEIRGPNGGVVKFEIDPHRIGLQIAASATSKVLLPTIVWCP